MKAINVNLRRILVWLWRSTGHSVPEYVVDTRKPPIPPPAEDGSWRGVVAMAEYCDYIDAYDKKMEDEDGMQILR